MSKVLQVSDDSGTTWYTIPGSDADLNSDGDSVDDTILGQTFSSNITGLITWSASGNAYYKGFAGYVADLKKAGTPAAVTGEAMSLVSGKTYKIDTFAKEVWDRSVTPVIKDNAVTVGAVDIESIDYLFGTVTFVSSYTVTGPVTADITYMPMAVFGKAQSFSLTQNANALDTSDYQTVQTNGGFKTFSAGLRTVSLELSNIFDSSEAWQTALSARDEIVIEINPDGNGKSVARGFFRQISTGQSGTVGDNELESVSFALSVPESDIVPFGWNHESDTTLADGIVKTLDAWEGQIDIDVQYLHDGTNGNSGTAVVTEVSMSSDINGMNEFSVGFNGDGALVAVP